MIVGVRDRYDGMSKQGRLNYYIGGEVMTLCHLEHPMYMLGYLPKEDRVYMMDKQQGIYSYRVRQAMLQYQVGAGGLFQAERFLGRIGPTRDVSRVSVLPWSFPI